MPEEAGLTIEKRPVPESDRPFCERARILRNLTLT